MRQYIPIPLKRVLCLVGLLSSPVHAEIDCTVKPYEGEIFKELYTATKATSDRLCQALIQYRLTLSPPELAALNAQTADALVGFADKAQAELDKKELFKAALYQAQFKAARATFSQYRFEDSKLPEFRMRRHIDTDHLQGFFMPLADETVARFDIDEQDKDGTCKGAAAGKTCQVVFKEFGSAFNPYRSTYNAAYDNTAGLNALSKQWDRFLDVSKSQTALEVLLTTLYHRDHFKQDHLVGPPGSQIIALHPHLIYSSMDKAQNDEEREFDLAVEWIGINFWDWKVPFGFSYATTYVDREGVEDKGQGIMLHINNRFSIGYSEHGDKDMVYITVDILKFFEKKKQQYQSYLNKYY